MHRKFITFTTFCLVHCTVLLPGQDLTEAYPLAEKGDFEIMMDSPNQFSEDMQAEIYLAHISKFFATNIDTVNQLYRQMQQFGEKTESNLVQSHAYSGLAFMHSLAGQIDSNEYYLQKALQHATDDSGRAVLLGSLGNVYMQKNEMPQAEAYIDSSIQLIKATNDSVLLANAFLEKTVFLQKKNHYHSALEMAIEAIKTSHKAWTKMKRANAYQIVGDLYFEIYDSENAEKYYQTALDICEKEGYERFKNELLVKLGNVAYKKGKLKKARKNYMATLDFHTAKNDYVKLIYLHSQLSKINIKKDKVSFAAERLEKAKGLLSSVNNKVNHIPFHSASGLYFTKKGNAKAAIQQYEQMLKIANEFGISSSQVHALESLRKLTKQSGNYSKAYSYADSLLAIQDRIDLASQQQLIYDLESKYQNQLKNAEIERLESDRLVKDLLINRRNWQLALALVGFLMALFAMWGFYRAYKIKQKLSNELCASLDANKMLIKEIHHRVKNNLQIVSSLLNIQSRFEKDHSVLNAINSGKYRVQSMSLLHQNLYVNEDLNHVRIKTYFSDLINAIVAGYSLPTTSVELSIDVADIELDIDTLVPLGLIANELITNSLKYAFTDQSKSHTLHFGITEDDDVIQLVVKDNGPGMPFNSLPDKSSSMGMQLIKSFAAKLNAEVTIKNSQGAEIAITFKKPYSQKLTVYAAS